MTRTTSDELAVGGFSAEDAYRKIRLGASLVPVLTGLVYEGRGRSSGSPPAPVPPATGRHRAAGGCRRRGRLV